MKMNPVISAVLVIALVLTGFDMARADDDHGDDYDRARLLQESGKILPLEKIIANTQRLHPNSKVLEIEFEERKHVYIYEIELVDKSGVVKELYINAATGELLKEKLND